MIHKRIILFSLYLKGGPLNQVTNDFLIPEVTGLTRCHVLDGKITMGHARALIGVPDAVEKAKEIIEKKLSVREVENQTAKFKKSKKQKNEKDPNISDLEKELSNKISKIKYKLISSINRTFNMITTSR